LRRFVGHTQSITSVSFSPNSENILTASKDGSVKLWNTVSGILLETISAHDGAVNDAIFSPSTGDILSIGNDSVARLWDTNGIHKHDFIGHKLPITSVVFSTCSKFIWTSSYDNTIKKWEVLSGILVHTYTGHRAPVLTLTLSQCCEYLVSSSKDLEIIVWDLSTNQMVQDVIPKSRERLSSSLESKEIGIELMFI